MESPSDQRLHLPELVRYRRELPFAQASAFVSLRAEILGCPVEPLTPRRWTRLLASRSPFVTGANPEPEHVIDFLWLMAPRWEEAGTPRAARRKARCTRRARWHFLQPWRRWLRLPIKRERVVASLVLATEQIRAFIAASFADAPAPRAKAVTPIGCLEAFFIREFGGALGWAPDLVSDTPISRLCQLHRFIRAARGEENHDEGEERILAAHLAKRNAERVKERAPAHG